MRLTPISFLLLVVLGCGRGAERTVFIGDGHPRAPKAGSFLAWTWSSLAPRTGAPVQLRAWSFGKTESNRSESTQAEMFARDADVVAVVGHAGSKGTLLALPVYRDAGMPVIVPTATSTKLLRVSPLVFMMAPTDAEEGEFIADHALDSLGARRVAILYVADAYGTGIRDGVVARLAARNLKVAGESALSGSECMHSPKLTVRGIVRALVARSRPDVLVLATASTQAACALEALRAEDDRMPVLASDSFDPSHPMVNELPIAARGRVSFVDFWDPESDSASRAFTQKMRTALGRDPYAGEALHWDAFSLLFAAIKEGHRTRASIGQWLSELGTAKHPPFQGVTGPISFNASRRSILKMRPLPAAPFARLMAP